MIFRKRKAEPSSAPDCEPRPEPDGRLDAGSPSSSSERADEGGREAGADEASVSAAQALDLVADLLRTYGEHAFDVGSRNAEEIETLFEAWARHLLVGIAPPRRASEEAEPAGERLDEPSPEKRDLPGLRLAFRDQRKLEQGYVSTTLGNFREATWAFISGLRRSLSAEQATDRRISHRMRRLEAAVRSGDAGRIKGEAQETVGLLTEFLAERGTRQQAEIMEMAARLESLRDELDSVRAQAATDGLTGLYNRAAFDEQIEREVDLATLFGRRPCLIMADVDHFKWVNDTYGHPGGDQVLKQFAETLSRCFMRRDDFIARYGGEEFVIVLRDLEISTAGNVAERAMNAIRNLEIGWEGIDEPIRITASLGIARLRKGETASAWLERADRALYRAKDGGRDRIELDPIDLEAG